MNHTRPVQFWYEWYESKPDGGKQWYRCYGLEVRVVQDMLITATKDMAGFRTGRMRKMV